MKLSEINYQDFKVLKIDGGIGTFQVLKLSTHNPNILNLSSMKTGYLHPDTEVEVVGILSLANDGPYYVLGGTYGEIKPEFVLIENLRASGRNVCVLTNPDGQFWESKKHIAHLFEVSKDISKLKFVKFGPYNVVAPQEHILTPEEQYLIKRAIDNKHFY